MVLVRNRERVKGGCLGSIYIWDLLLCHLQVVLDMAIYCEQRSQTGHGIECQLSHWAILDELLDENDCSSILLGRYFSTSTVTSSNIAASAPLLEIPHYSQPFLIALNPLFPRSLP